VSVDTYRTEQVLLRVSLKDREELVKVLSSLSLLVMSDSQLGVSILESRLSRQELTLCSSFRLTVRCFSAIDALDIAKDRPEPCSEPA